MVKQLLILVGLVSMGLAAWPAWADGPSAPRSGTGVATAIAVSPDGATLAVGSSIGVWFLSAAALAPASFWDTGQWVRTVAYSADGHYVRADDRFYDAAAGAPVLLAPGDLTWLARDCAPGRQRCLVYNHDTLLVRDQDTLIDIALLATGPMLDAAWSPDGTTIYGVAAGGVLAWDAGTGTLERSQTSFFTGSAHAPARPAIGTRVASAGKAREATRRTPGAQRPAGPAARCWCGPSRDGGSRSTTNGGSQDTR